MTTTTDFIDEELGRILIRTNPRARHIILRAQSGSILITAPPYTPATEIRRALERFRDSLKKSQQRIELRPIDLNFRIEAPLFRLSLTEGEKEEFMVRRRDGEMQLICPPHTDFTAPGRQEWLRKVIEEGMRRQAKLLLPPRLQALSDTSNLPYRSLKINSSKGRWGSCSGTKNINLSYFLVLLPEHLIEYVMLHELSHTVEMNHGERFWALLDRLTAGKAHALRNELHRYSPSF